MQIFKGVLSDGLMQKIKQEIAMLINQNVWKSSQMSWPKDILKNVIGDCSITFVGNEVAFELARQLKDKLPASSQQVFQYYIWKHNAAISLHEDTAYKYGATIYLNDWDLDLGGIFLWKEGSELKGFCPEANAMVLNNANEPHLVTPVNPMASSFRYTVQVWGL